MSENERPPVDWDTDWRIMGQEGYLMDREVVYRKFDRSICVEDFDQCEFCWAVFDKDPENPELAYHVPSEKVWICEGCFEDFLPFFHWKVIAPPSQE